MFTIEVKLNDIDLTGLEALDWRRVHGLPDGNRLYAQNWRSVKEDGHCVKIDESFSRVWFPKNQTCQLVWVNANQLKSEELKIDRFDDNRLVPCLPDEVVKSLYVKQRTELFAWQALPWWKTLWYIMTNQTP